MIQGLRTYSVNARARQPLIDFMVRGLTDAGCYVIHSSPADRAPFVIAFQTQSGERMGIVAYAFLATRTPTNNRPDDERSFQIKYGSKADYHDTNIHELWQDPLGMFTTLLIGIDPEAGFCVSADPIIHSPTKFYIRLEFKDEHADAIARRGWFCWERIKRRTPLDAPRVETLVGAAQRRFLDLVRFERAARGLDPGNRLILGEAHALALPTGRVTRIEPGEGMMELAEAHPLVKQFGLASDEILDLIAGARRLKMAVRGWVAEEHLRSTLAKTPGITHCERLDEEGGPDLRVSYKHGPLLTVECKNVSRERDRLGNPKIDFQRTRSAKGNPCSRYYEPSDFDVIAACLHAVTDDWDFRYVLPGSLPPHKSCEGRIASNIRVDKQWVPDAAEMFLAAYAARGVAV
jgi:restriction-modification system family protein